MSEKTVKEEISNIEDNDIIFPEVAEVIFNVENNNGCILLINNSKSTLTEAVLADTCRTQLRAMQVEIWWSEQPGAPIEKVIYRFPEASFDPYKTRVIRRRQPSCTIISEKDMEWGIGKDVTSRIGIIRKNTEGGNVTYGLTNNNIENVVVEYIYKTGPGGTGRATSILMEPFVTMIISMEPIIVVRAETEQV